MDLKNMQNTTIPVLNTNPWTRKPGKFEAIQLKLLI